MSVLQRNREERDKTLQTQRRQKRDTRPVHKDAGSEKRMARLL